MHAKKSVRWWWSIANSEERKTLEERIDAAEKRIERRLLRGNLRLIALKKRIEKLEEQLKKVPRAVPYCRPATRRMRDRKA